MTYTETQLEAIKILGRKDLGFGCLIFRKEKQIIHQMDSHDIPCDEGEIWRERGNAEPYLLTKNFEILGHIPHLEDLFRVAEENGLSFTYYGGRVLNHIIFHIDDDTDIKIPLDARPLLDQTSLPDILNLFK